MQITSWCPLPSSVLPNLVCNLSKCVFLQNLDIFWDCFHHCLSYLQFQQMFLPLSLILQDECSPHNKLYCFFKCWQGEYFSSVFLPSAVSCLGAPQQADSQPRPTLPSHSLPPTQPQPYPSVGGSAAQDESLRLGTHTHSQHGPTALKPWLSFPSPTQKQKHTHTHTLPTHMQYPNWFLEHLFNDVMCLTSEGSRGRGNTWECVGCTCCLCVFVSE